MTTAADLLSNIQSTYSICITVHGRTIVDRMPAGNPDVDDLIMGALTYETAVPSAWGNGIQDTIGAITLMHTPDAPLTDLIALDFRNAPYEVEVCGVLNEGLFNEEVVTFENRLLLANGLCNFSRWSGDEFLISLGSDSRGLETNILETSVGNTDELVSTDFNFSVTSTTLAETGGEIDIDVSITNTTSNSQTINLGFGVDISELELSLEPAGVGDVHTSFNFTDIDPISVVNSVGIGITVSIQNTTSTTQLFTVDFDRPIDEMDWIFRFIEYETITSWSVAPDSIVPPFPHQGNSVLTWTNLGGIKQITFTITGLPSPHELIPDEGGRIYFTSAFKIWPTRVLEAKAFATGLSFDVAPSQLPPLLFGALAGSGAYLWSGLSHNSINLTAVFSGVSGANPLVITADDGWIIIQNEDSVLRLVVSRVYKDSTVDASKQHLRYLPLGAVVENITPTSKGNRVYDPGTGGFPDKVRDQGVEMPRVFTQGELDTNHTNGVKSWASDLNPPFSDNTFQVSGDVEEITCDVQTLRTDLGDAVFKLCDIGNITVGNVDLVFNKERVSWLFTRQQTVRQALNALLSPIDASWRMENGLMVVEDRVGFSTEHELVLDEADDMEHGSLTFDDPLDSLHELTVGYAVNWTVQDDVAAYKNPYKSVMDEDETVKYSDYPTNTILSGSRTREVVTCFVTTTAANRVMNKLQTYKLRQVPFNFYGQGNAWTLPKNRSIKIDSPIGLVGMAVIESVLENTDTRDPYATGVLYVQ